MLLAIACANGLDGGGGVHAAGRDEDAAVDDKPVFQIMTAAPIVHHRPFGIGGQQMPDPEQDRAVHADIGRAGGGGTVAGDQHVHSFIHATVPVRRAVRMPWDAWYVERVGLPLGGGVGRWLC